VKRPQRTSGNYRQAISVSLISLLLPVIARFCLL
jgi:hypothetical protein